MPLYPKIVDEADGISLDVDEVDEISLLEDVA